MKKLLLILPVLFVAAIGLGSFTGPRAEAKPAVSQKFVATCTPICMPIVGCVGQYCSLPNQWSACTNPSGWPPTGWTYMYAASGQRGTCVQAPTGSYVDNLADYGLDNVFVSFKTGLHTQINFYENPTWGGLHGYVPQSTGVDPSVGNGISSMTITVQ